jgi:hypothetical protein
LAACEIAVETTKIDWAAHEDEEGNLRSEVVSFHRITMEKAPA